MNPKIFLYSAMVVVLAGSIPDMLSLGNPMPIINTPCVLASNVSNFNSINDYMEARQMCLYNASLGIMSPAAQHEVNNYYNKKYPGFEVQGITLLVGSGLFLIYRKAKSKPPSL